MAENSFDKLLGRNGELVEERKKQVLAGALEIVQRHCDETPNKMEGIAALFGKRLGEEFKVYHKCRETLKCKITDNGLSFYYDAYGRWWEDSGLLIELLKGEAVIVDE
ncbi:hypothetical protein SELR_18330 [Selenomonas ruminantium subsp. lactilytica TAM6421]|uniref:Uncharacterized protein n=1 Tax=Selenomonas ruminantium subsp. lactilytica (strain NBRC 103574 / TAM6421) TaxID=927704 RepID=I0GS04_SELRL|nr:hypothetical protein [Selenomonas ruminantium]BAL83541.1 hypothetical protein SELR_18330 [Selenomonas ruminantium subsp. lactilytica TAM6421]